MGPLKIDPSFEVLDFYEKPNDPKILRNYRLEEDFLEKIQGKDPKERYYLGSMGIYVFKRSALLSLLEDDQREDFGKHLIPTQIPRGKTVAFYYGGYWEDIGTIEASA